MIGRIYKLVSNKTRCVYIGSTIRPLKERLYSHRGVYKQWKRKKYPTYRKVFTIMKHRDVKIIRLEKLEFDSLEELRKREKYWIKKYKKMGMKCINQNSAYRLGCGYSEKEYQEKYQCLRYKCKKCGSTVLLRNKSRHFKTSKHTF